MESPFFVSPPGTIRNSAEGLLGSREDSRSANGYLSLAGTLQMLMNESFRVQILADIDAQSHAFNFALRQTRL